LKRRNALKLMAAAMLAPFLPAISLSETKPQVVQGFTELDLLVLQLDLLNRQFPNVSVLTIAGQTISPVLNNDGSLSDVSIACLYSGQPSVLDGGIVELTGCVPGKHAAAAFIREDGKRHPWAVIEWTPEGVAEARHLITTVAIKLQQWAEHIGIQTLPSVGIPYFQTANSGYLGLGRK
jgi:hypothetical protein